MKILLKLTLILLILACSSDSENKKNNNNSLGRITPPSWIQGTWVNLEIYKDTGYKVGYMFSTDDLCILSSSTDTCWKKLVDDSHTTNYPFPMTVVQEISDKEYSCTITHGSQTNNFKFKKISSTTIEILNDGTILTKIQ